VAKEKEKSRKLKHQKLLIQRDNDDFRSVAFGMFFETDLRIIQKYIINDSSRFNPTK